MSKFSKISSLLLRASLLVAVATSVAPAQAQLRIATWNVSFWRASDINANRIAAFKSAIYGVYQGRSLAPDVLMIQEVYTATDLTTFKTLMNTAPGSPGDWEVATFLSGPDSQSCLLYRTSKVDLTGDSFIASLGTTNTSLPPRHGIRYIVRAKGYLANQASIALYNLHMKSSSDQASQDRRKIEADRIVANAATLPSGTNFLVAGDFNIQTSSQAAYVSYVGTVALPGPFYDPIKTPGSWNNNSAYRNVDTQDPGFGIPGGTTPGYMDDRLDFILLSAGLIDGSGLDYIGNPNIPYAAPITGTPTWNDPNHSYRVWGNDGMTFNTGLNPITNTMTGPTITQAILDSLVDGAGHLAVYLDMKVPPKAAVDTVYVDFGYVRLDAPAMKPIVITNSGDTGLWTTNGISNLSYSITPSAHFFATSATGVDTATAGGNTHQIVFNAAVPGRVTETITLNTNDPDRPTINVVCTGVAVQKITRNPR